MRQDLIPDTPLYAICDAEVCDQAGWPLVDLARACLDGGARVLQLRAKTLDARQFVAAASAIVELAATAGALVVVNDRADIARLAGAGGVHVGQDDLPPRAVRDVLAAPLVVGLSTHSEPQLKAALLEPVDYVAMGPVFTTQTKQTGYDARGLDLIRMAARHAAAHQRPLVAIGGITLANAATVIEAGARSVAVISDLLVSRDPAGRVREYLRALA